jgi:hypothetical protein
MPQTGTAVYADGNQGRVATVFPSQLPNRLLVPQSDTGFELPVMRWSRPCHPHYVKISISKIDQRTGVR